MPLARIDISNKAPETLVRVISDFIYEAMVEVANVPVNDKFLCAVRNVALFHGRVDLCQLTCVH